MAHNEDYYLRRAIKGFKILVIYFCVSRPQYEKAYRKNGKFSIDELIRQETFLASWNNRSRADKKQQFKRYKQYSKTSNYTFGIPKELVYEIIGKYQHKRISKDKVIGELVRKGWLKIISHGSKTGKDDSGEWKKFYSFRTKYHIANKRFWLRLLSDPRWKDYTTYPRDKNGFVERAVKIISKWVRSWRDVPEPKDEPQEVRVYTPAEKQWISLSKFVKNSINEMVHEFETGRMDYSCLERAFRDFNVGKELYEYLEKRAYQRKREWEAKMNELNK